MNLDNRQMKQKTWPRIYINNGWWVCQCVRNIGIGSSPVIAYNNWNKQFDKIDKYFNLT